MNFFLISYMSLIYLLEIKFNYVLDNYKNNMFKIINNFFINIFNIIQKIERKINFLGNVNMDSKCYCDILKCVILAGFIYLWESMRFFLIRILKNLE